MGGEIGRVYLHRLVTFIDSYNGFKDTGNAATLYDDDNFHLSERGYAL